MIYSTRIQEIGQNAKDFLNEGFIILFGADAPAELKPYCFIVEKNDVNDEIEVGDIMTIGDEKYNIIAVGNQVTKNLRDLSHITINFKGDISKLKPGSLYLEKKPLCDIKVGTKITIEKVKIKEKIEAKQTV